MTTCLRVSLALLFFAVDVDHVRAQDPPTPPQIASVTMTGVNGATWGVGTHGLNSSVGDWAGTYRVSEPIGNTTLRITINVNDGGQIVFSHWLQTFDTTEYDWASIYLETPTGRVNIATKVGRPTKWESPCCVYWSTRTIPFFRTLDAWRHQQITLVVDLTNDGYGDQTQMNIVNLAFPACRRKRYAAALRCARGRAVLDHPRRASRDGEHDNSWAGGARYLLRKYGAARQLTAERCHYPGVHLLQCARVVS